jgi:hypothetical protein
LLIVPIIPVNLDRGYYALRGFCYTSSFDYGRRYKIGFGKTQLQLKMFHRLLRSKA